MWIVIGVVAILLVGLFIRSGGRIIALEYEDFPQSELEKLWVNGTGAPQGEFMLSGPLQVEAHSRWTWLAMKLFAGTFMVDVHIDGQKATLVVDTGASATVLSPQLAVHAKAILSAEGPKIFHWGQEIPTYLGWLRELELAGLVARYIPIIVLGKQPIIRLLGLPVYRLDGLLGMSLLHKLVVTLDWQSGTVTLGREPLHLATPSAPLQLFEKQVQGFKLLSPITKGFLDGSGPYTILIDTGTSSPEALISEEVLQSLEWKGNKSFLIQRLRLGEIELENVLAFPASRREATGVPLKGAVILVGNGLFQAKGVRRLILDFLAGKLYIER